MDFYLIEKYFPNLDNEKKEKFILLGNLYHEWNQKINLISRKDICSLYEKHILHSLSISKIISFKDNTKILDVGTGGGFPGIPLAILFPNCSFTLIDSIGKKIKVVDDIVYNLNLKNIKTINNRAENITDVFDFITSRAVTQFPDFFSWVKNNFSKNSFNDLKNGILYIKGGDFSNEMKYFKNIKIHNISDFFEEPFFETKKIIYLPL